MKSILLLLCLTFCFVSCKQEAEPITISGTALNVPNGLRVYLKKVDGNGTPIALDTAIVMNEKFDFGLQESQELSDQRLISLDGTDGMLLFVSENQPIEIELRNDSIMSSNIKAGKENEIFSEYIKLRIEQATASQKIRANQQEIFENEGQEGIAKLKAKWEANQASYNEKTITLIKEHPDAIVAPVALQSLFYEYRMEPEKVRELYNVIDTRLQNLPIMESINEKLLKTESIAIGKKAPYFEGKNPEGNVVKLPEVLGKVTLIDFWASWCGPCRKENPNVVDAYQQFHDKGFHIISVSLDRPEDEAKWIAAIEQDNMTWNHISRLKHWSDPIAQLYNVSAIPATFLLDENGVIIARDLRGKSLHNKLAEVLN
ncbi:Peroxiredoxin [Nonlabens sp. Hel1_33_55]|uniref:TlpA disulfide reductase family protein n=1 Tax=Nonlabens sp. Hel1_33_55 TaxID=1336802 RepID=UPI000875EF7A|nr:TlpA disulfide reductase family protein [Nonlabens sp. Hel1_33_55]SCY01919.1 Peroxiredoxin [Nonlabens sp. Hel1_33_55]